MGRPGAFLPRLLALTAVWLLATAALTYAAAQRISAPRPATATTAQTATRTTPTKVLVVPDVRSQAYVFAEGTLGDAGFAWRVQGSVQGYAANTVTSQTPAPGTRVLDTGLPTIVLRLAHGGREAGVPQNTSPLAGTPVRLAVPAVPAVTPAATRTVQATPAPRALPKAATPKKVAEKAPAQRWPQHRPPAFVVPGARREPLDEMPLPDRAAMLLRWIDSRPKPTDWNVGYWLYQHAWIVTGAEFGWWHGAQALHTLLAVDDHVWGLWGIGDRSKVIAEQALAEVEARSR